MSQPEVVIAMYRPKPGQQAALDALVIKHPAVAQIWEAMAMVCDFGTLDQLPEAKNPFPHFTRPFESC